MKRFLSLALIASLSLGLAACGGSGSSSSPQTAAQEVESAEMAEDAQENEEAGEKTEDAGEVERVSLNVAYMPNYASMWIFMAAIETGAFDEEGIDVTLYEFADGPTEVAAMESGSIDLAYIGDGAHRLAANGNCKIFMYSQIGDAEMVIGLPSHGVNSLEDLKGKKVAYSSGTTGENMLLNALDSVGYTMDDIEAYDMDTSNMVTAMLSGSLDACSTWSPNTRQILNQIDEAVRLCSPKDFIESSVSLSSFVVMEDWMDENYDVLLRFTRALFKAMDFAGPEENRPEVSEWIATQLASDVQTIIDQNYDGDYLSGEELYAALQDGTIRNYYEMQLNKMKYNETADDDVVVDDYVMFDVMFEAAQSLYD